MRIRDVSTFISFGLMLLLCPRSQVLALNIPILRSTFKHTSRYRDSFVGSPSRRTLSNSNMVEPNFVRDALIECPTIPMRNGVMHPSIGFGTYKVGYIPPSSSEAAALAASNQPQRSAVEIITDALASGYRFLECAEFYNNEAEIGRAIAEYNKSASEGIPRSELFLCSKVWTTTIENGPAAIRAQLEKTLSDLQTDYLDLYLIHWPVPVHHVAAYKTLIELRNEGKIRGIGVSNYVWEDYLELKNDPDIDEADLPLVNQIEINPFLYRAVTIEKFRGEGVVLQSYRSLRDGKAMTDPKLVELATKYKKTTAQILGRWCVQHGFVYTPKSAKLSRMLENASVFDFTLADDDMAALDALTTPQALENFRELYRKCVNRDTSKDGTLEGVKMNCTIN